MIKKEGNPWSKCIGALWEKAELWKSSAKLSKVSSLLRKAKCKDNTQSRHFEETVQFDIEKIWEFPFYHSVHQSPQVSEPWEAQKTLFFLCC